MIATSRGRQLTVSPYEGEAMINRRFVLASRPNGMPRRENFRLEEAPVPTPGRGQILVRNKFISVDPGMRLRLSDRKTYAEPVAVGALVGFSTVGTVIASENPGFEVDDWVAGFLGWQEYGLAESKGVHRIVDLRVPVSTAIGVLGIPGLTGYFGLLDLGQPKAGETVLVTSAAGPVGSTAGQIAAIKGCRVVGVAGGKAKCRWLAEELGFAAAIDYRAETDLSQAIVAACPNGVDILFDNIGNAMVDRLLPLMNQFGRIVISGQTADYNLPPAERHGLKNTLEFISKRLTMRGLAASDYAARFAAAATEMTDWILAGRLKYREDIEDGFEHLPEAFIGLFEGTNFGRKLIKLP
jgi:NADPH-dependent curcumin reductase